MEISGQLALLHQLICQEEGGIWHNMAIVHKASMKKVWNGRTIQNKSRQYVLAPGRNSPILV
jgi:hypothetical protein